LGRKILNIFKKIAVVGGMLEENFILSSLHHQIFFKQ
jgi:hypothetical protein